MLQKGEKRCGRETEGKGAQVLDRRVNIAIRFHGDEKPTATNPLEAPAIRATRKSSFVEPLEHATREHIAIRGGDHTDEAREHTQIGTHDETCSMSRTVRRVLRVQRISGEEDDQHER